MKRPSRADRQQLILQKEGRAGTSVMALGIERQKHLKKLLANAKYERQQALAAYHAKKREQENLANAIAEGERYDP